MSAIFILKDRKISKFMLFSSVVTVSHLARSVDFCLVLKKKPRFRYGSVFILLCSNSLWSRRRPRRWQNKSNDGWWMGTLSGWSLAIDIC